MNINNYKQFYSVPEPDPLNSLVGVIIAVEPTSDAVEGMMTGVAVISECDTAACNNMIIQKCIWITLQLF